MLFDFVFSLIILILSGFLNEQMIVTRVKLGQRILAIEGMLIKLNEDI